MNLFKKKKSIYLLLMGILTLLGVVIVPTYARFPSSYITGSDVVQMEVSYNISITDVEEYQEIIVSPWEVVKMNVQIANNSDNDIFYGIWYKMINPEKLPEDTSIQIGKIVGTTGTTNGVITSKESTTTSIGLINNTKEEVKIYLGVGSSTVGVNDIEYINGKYLITGEVADLALNDINITHVTVDDKVTNGPPVNGNYTMEYFCKEGTKLRWDTYNKTVVYEKGAKVGDNCNLKFTSNKDISSYPLLNTMPVGSYVAYVGSGGAVGKEKVSCQSNGDISSSIVSGETESSNSCLGMNAREDIDVSGYTYGYCSNSDSKYYTTGWRIAYIKDNKVKLISAGSPECLLRDEDVANSTYIKTANANALKYCNSNFVDGDCNCTSNSNGQCSEISTDAWAMNDEDFYHITKAISGAGKRLTDTSSTLGDDLGSLSSLYCDGKSSYMECGYNNDLIDNGGYYWFASRYNPVSTSGVMWDARKRSVQNTTSIEAYGLRPIINLSSTVYVTGGTGTMEDPYTIANS